MSAAKGVKAAFARIEVKSRAELRRWFERNHAQDESVWIVTWKKAPGAPHVPYGDVRDEALCFGWIDSRPAKVDSARSMLLVSPRKKKSGWSAVNKGRIAALIAEGRMTAAGLAKMKAAQADGSWEKLDAVESLAEPKDLLVALKAHAGAQAFWDAFPPSTRRGILEWISQARKPETRAARVEKTARLAAENVRANMPRQSARSRGVSGARS